MDVVPWEAQTANLTLDCVIILIVIVI